MKMNVRKKRKRFLAYIIVLFTVPLIMAVLSINICAVENDSDNSQISDIRDAIPEEVKEYIPDMTSEESENALSYDAGLLVRAAAKITLKAIGPVFSDFALICGTVLLASVVRKISEGITNSSLSSACGYASTLCIALPLINVVTRLWDSVSASLEQLTLFMNAILPVMGSLYAAGGNFTASVANNASMVVIFTAIENICTYCLYPVLRICFGISLLTCVGGGINLRGVSSFIRGVFTTGLSFLMVLFSLIMGYQNKLAVAADNAAARTIKFAVSNMIPVVGSVAGEAMRAVVGGIGTIRSAAGLLTVIAIILIVLPIIISLLLHRLTLRAASITAQILGCEKEQLFIDEMNGIMGFALAIVAACSILFIFCVTLLVKCSTAVSA